MKFIEGYSILHSSLYLIFMGKQFYLVIIIIYITEMKLYLRT